MSIRGPSGELRWTARCDPLGRNRGSGLGAFFGRRSGQRARNRSAGVPGSPWHFTGCRPAVAPLASKGRAGKHSRASWSSSWVMINPATMRPKRPRPRTPSGEESLCAKCPSSVSARDKRTEPVGHVRRATLHRWVSLIPPLFCKGTARRETSPPPPGLRSPNQPPPQSSRVEREKLGDRMLLDSRRCAPVCALASRPQRVASRPGAAGGSQQHRRSACAEVCYPAFPARSECSRQAPPTRTFGSLRRCFNTRIGPVAQRRDRGKPATSGLRPLVAR
jgi:hypothetical protein